MNDVTTPEAAYIITARPFYKADDRVFYLDEDGEDDVLLGDVLDVEPGYTIDGDGDVVGTLERTGRSYTINVRGCLTAKSDVDLETVSVKHIAEALLDFGSDALVVEAVIALAIRRQNRG